MSNDNPSNQWKKGQSGNPAGRPKRAAALQAKCREFNDELIDILVSIARNDELSMGHSSASRVAAAKTVLAYGNGLPNAKVTIEDSEGKSPLSRDQLLAIAAMPIPEIDNPSDDEADAHH